MKERINNQIRASQVRVIDDVGGNLGIMPLSKALEEASSRGVDLIEIGPNAQPPIVKLMEFGKYQYLEAKKQKKMRAGAKPTETKSVQVKVATGDHDLELKAKKASEWLKEGHRIKVELYLSGRTKYMDEKFLKERLDRMLHLVTENFKIAEPAKKSPKGLMLTIERDTKKKE